MIEFYQYILEILKKYNIPSTFAFVGAMTETKDRFIEETLNLNERVKSCKMAQSYIQSNNKR